jgi:hypothetical protein
MSPRLAPPDDGLAVMHGREAASDESVRSPRRRQLLYLLLGVLAAVAVLAALYVAVVVFKVIWVVVLMMRAFEAPN